MTLAIAVILLPTVAAPASLAVYSLRLHKTCVALREQVLQLRGEAAQTRVDLRERRELDSVKDEFISTVSHELRTPLTSIRGALGLLSAGLMGKVDDRAANLLRIASSNTDRLVRLINDILDLERMSSGSAPLQLQTCSVRDLILQSVDTMTAMAAEAKVLLTVVPELGNPSQLCEVDPDRLQQVFTNLLSNAIKFSTPGAVIRIRTEAKGKTITISVKDGGRGVPAGKLESIFERFQQVEAADSRQKGGTGLGLAICRSIVQQHGGHIWAERNDTRTADEAGTTFLVRLIRLDVPALTTMTAGPSLPANTTARGTILVVDDDPGVRTIVAEHVRTHGYEVLETDSGQNALGIAASRPLAAILLDLYMPGLTGWETVDGLKANPRTASIPVVILSVLSPLTRHGSGISLAGRTEGWIQKPFNPNLLLAELGRILNRGQGPARVLLVESGVSLSSVVLSSFANRPPARKVQVDLASCLQEAVSICEKQAPAVLILDLDLPDSSGFALISWLRRQPALCMLPLVVCSGREVTEEEMEQLRLGPTHFLTKAHIQPREVEELVSAMVPAMQASFREQPSA